MAPDTWVIRWSRLGQAQGSCRVYLLGYLLSPFALRTPKVSDSSGYVCPLPLTDKRWVFDPSLATQRFFPENLEVGWRKRSLFLGSWTMTKEMWAGGSFQTEAEKVVAREDEAVVSEAEMKDRAGMSVTSQSPCLGLGAWPHFCPPDTATELGLVFPSFANKRDLSKRVLR